MSDFSTFRRDFFSKVEAVLQEREGLHGDPAMFLDQVAALSREPKDAFQVLHVLLSLKLARAERNPFHEDSWIDLAGYAAVGAYLRSRLLTEGEG